MFCCFLLFHILMPYNIILYFRLLNFHVPKCALYLHCSWVLSFYIDVVLTLSYRNECLPPCLYQSEFIQWLIREGISNTDNDYLIVLKYIDGLVQDCSNSSAIPMEFLQSCTEPAICNIYISLCINKISKLFMTPLRPDIHNIAQC